MHHKRLVMHTIETCGIVCSQVMATFAIFVAQIFLWNQCLLHTSSNAYSCILTFVAILYVVIAIAVIFHLFSSTE